LTDPDGARARWGSRWAALEAYDLEQARTKTVSAVNGQLLRTIGVRRISPEKLREAAAPVSLIWGTDDRLMRFTIAERAAARYGWPLHRIEGCGHGPHIERPDELADAIVSSMEG
jgi:pimeloyl-ACP methyl ester carboxylesterase